MNKLQLYITTSHTEFQTRVEINSDPYVQSWVCDLRDTVSQVDYPSSSVSIFYMIKYIDTGVFIVVLRTIPKSPGSHLAAWIFIPYSLRIPDKDILGIVNFITTKVEGSEVTPQDIQQMREAFSHDYEENVLYPVFATPDGLSYAYRYYGPRTGTTLQALLGPYRYQPCYLSFAGVLLINQDITTNVAGTNLTSAPLDDMAVLLPPQHAEVDGYRPTLYGQLFDMPTYVPMSRNIDIVWERQNSADIKQTLYVAQSEMRTPPLNTSSPTPLPVREKPAEPTKTAVSPAQPENKPSEPAERTHVPDRKKTYHFQIPAKSAAIGTVIEFEITTNADIADSPIDGYVAASDIQEGAGRSNHLFYKAGNGIRDKWINNSLYALGGGVIGALIMLLCMSTCSHDDKDKVVAESIEVVSSVAPAAAEAPAAQNQEVAAETPTANNDSKTTPVNQEQAANAAVTDKSLEAAIKYLDSNQIWEKAQMESYPDLQGLYDDMNKIERRKLVETWGPRLADSRTFVNIVRHARLSYKKTARKTPFNPPSETSIRIQAYLNNIDP